LLVGQTSSTDASFRLQLTGAGGSIHAAMGTNSNVLRFSNVNTSGVEWAVGTSSPGVANAGNFLSFTQFSGGSWSERARIDSSGNFTLDPSGNGSAYLQLNTSSGGDGHILLQRGGSNRWQISSGPGNALQFYNYSTGSESARITSGGFMGIGTSSPVSRLHVNGAFTVEGGPNVFVLFNSGARPDNSTGYRLNEAYGAQWAGSASSRIWHSSFVNSSICVGFTPNGSDFGNGNGYFTGTVTQNYSDIRLKNDLGTIDNALNKVMQLRGFRYTINKLGQDLGFNDDGVEVGLSAQDVQAVLPEAVMLTGVDMAPGENGEVISKSGENYLTLRYDRVVPLLVNAIQEQQAIIEQLKARLDAANL
jgi:hypothetical protein